MDSANSGSIQSSSTAGDEEYDSRAELSPSSSISAFLNNNPPPPPQPTTLTTHVRPFSAQCHQTHLFDPLSNYLDPTQRLQSHPNPNQILDLDMVCSKVAARSEPDLAGLIPCSSSSSPNNNNHLAFLLTQSGASQSQPRVNVGGAFPTTLPPESASSPQGGNSAVRNPKKRSRASRRSPTTVLITNTTNFRAMVQEFTGIPAPPFTSSSFQRTRLDLFASSSAIGTASTLLEQPPTQTPPYLFSPFAHKVQAQPFSNPPMLNTLASNSTSNNYQQHSLNMHNPILQPPPLWNNNSSVLVQQPSLEISPSAVDSHLKMDGWRN